MSDNHDYVARHTPGPWTVEKGNVGSLHPLFVVAPDRDGLRPWCDADARLIAAAPELLEALDACQDLLFASADEGAELGTYGRDCWEAMQAARAAIAKAKGA